MSKQYYKLIKARKRLVDKISNIWFALFIIIESCIALLIALTLGFSFEQLSLINANTENGTLLGMLVLIFIPFSGWLTWGFSALPFVVLGKLEFSEFKFIMLKFRYPIDWLDKNL